MDAGAVDGLKLKAVMEGNDISEGEMGESAALIDYQIVGVCVREREMQSSLGCLPELARRLCFICSYF